MEIKNATIYQADIQYDHGIMHCSLVVEYGDGSTQGFASYGLFYPSRQEILGIGGHYIHRLMNVAGVESWSKMVGRPVRVKVDHGIIVAIGHFASENWFAPAFEYAGIGKTEDHR